MSKNYLRCQNYLEQGLGLMRGKVALLPYDNKWNDFFEQETKLIKEKLPIKKLELHHCGSTSVKGLCAKPIIDILGVLPNLELLDQNQRQLEILGYEYKGEYGIQNRRFCVLYNEEKTVSLIHLHFFPIGCEEIKKHLLFRDYLRINEAAKKEYAELKMKLIQDLTPRELYPEAKTHVIQKILASAYEYFKV